MSDELIFMMGKYEARLPAHLRYVESHFWVSPTEEGLRVGLNAFAVRLLQDVYFLDWGIEPGSTVHPKQDIGQIESSKAVSTIFAPLAGQILRFNPALLNDPSLINVDSYGAGWLYDMQSDSPTLSASEYVEHLNATWDQTQRMLKNQFNESP